MENKIEYLKLFTTSEDYNSFVDSDTTNTPYVALCEDTEDVYFVSRQNTNGIEYVDLGLPSGTLWATKNVGAESTTDYGLLFTWGGTTGAQVSLDDSGNFVYGTATYKFGTDGNMNGNGLWGETTPGGEKGWLKYTESDNRTKLLPKDDTARHYMGGDWHLPSNAQVKELNDECVVNRVGNGTKGFAIRYTNKKDDSQYVDFPLCGYAKENGEFVSKDNYFYLTWTNELSEDFKHLAYTFGTDVDEQPSLQRNYGCLCRGVIGQIIEE